MKNWLRRGTPLVGVLGCSPRRAATKALGLVLSCASLLSVTTTSAAPTLRVQVDQRGDFVAIGNTFGWECAGNVTAPVVGTTPTAGNCGNSTADSAPDVHWRSDDAAGTAAANTTIAPADARSTAVLALPAGATVTHAFLYWGAKKAGAGADAVATLEKLGAGGAVDATLTATAVAADQFTLDAGGGNTYYQSVADVTAFVQAEGVGAYRMSGVDMVDFRSRNDQTSFGAWSLVVLYEDPIDPPRNLVIFDGLDQVSNGAPAAATLDGFVVPLAGFDAKLGVITYEGDATITGDQLRFGVAPLGAGDALSDGVNLENNFFNGTRSFLGTAVSVAGDLPQLTGGAGTMSGVDLDIVDITSRLVPGQTAADIEATSSGDLYLLGAFVTSISTFKPDLSTSSKDAIDVDGGALLVGDELLFRIVATNTGNDNAVSVVMTDPLPANVSFVPGSIEIVSGANDGAKTDAAGDDQAEYDAGTHTVTVRLGTGADETNGGLLAAGESTTVEFRVTVNLDASGVIENQAFIDFEGEQGSPPETTPTDGNGDEPGTPPTEVIIEECLTDADCPDERPACDTEADPNECVPCLTDAHCDDPTPICDTEERECVECVDDDDCAGTNGTCDPESNTCVCEPVPGGEVCGNDIDEDCDGVLDNGCGCVDDSDCPGPPDDGVVCDTEDTFTCVPGCRDRVGSGCPTGEICTSSDDTLGECVDEDGIGADDGVFVRGGCSCNVPGSRGAGEAVWLLLVGLAALARRRKRS